MEVCTTMINRHNFSAPMLLTMFIAILLKLKVFYENTYAQLTGFNRQSTFLENIGFSRDFYYL